MELLLYFIERENLAIECNAGCHYRSRSLDGSSPSHAARSIPTAHRGSGTLPADYHRAHIRYGSFENSFQPGPTCLRDAYTPAAHRHSRCHRCSDHNR